MPDRNRMYARVVGGAMASLVALVAQMGCADRDLDADTMRPQPTPPDVSGMVRIPAGVLQVGCDPDAYGAEYCSELGIDIDLEYEMEEFFIDPEETTWARYCDLIPIERCDTLTPAETARPVTGMEIEDALEYCELRGLRFPTEWEFLRAARGSSSDRYPWGPDPLNCSYDDPEWPPCATTFIEHPRPPRSSSLDVSQFGVWDLSGNVREWLADTSFTVCGKQSGINCLQYPFRAGSFADDDPRAFELTRRFEGRNLIQNGAGHTVGFRCATRTEWPF